MVIFIYATTGLVVNMSIKALHVSVVLLAILNAHYGLCGLMQVFQLDSQYVAGADVARSTDDNKSYVFLFYSPLATNTAASVSSATAASAEDSVLVAR